MTLKSEAKSLRLCLCLKWLCIIWARISALLVIFLKKAALVMARLGSDLKTSYSNECSVATWGGRKWARVNSPLMKASVSCDIKSQHTACLGFMLVLSVRASLCAVQHWESKTRWLGNLAANVWSEAFKPRQGKVRYVFRREPVDLMLKVLISSEIFHLISIFNS